VKRRTVVANEEANLGINTTQFVERRLPGKVPKPSAIGRSYFRDGFSSGFLLATADDEEFNICLFQEDLNQLTIGILRPSLGSPDAAGCDSNHRHPLPPNRNLTGQRALESWRQVGERIRELVTRDTQRLEKEKNALRFME
jgi:hypothetical protein